ncbi:MAG: MerR family transcriptional regulator [Pseudomonadota bacterium]
MAKSADAFRTISEVADWLGVQTHVLRFWESKFSQVKPVKRAGGRRYYRPADMLLLGGIRKLLHDDGLTIKGVQKILREEGMAHVADLSPPLDEVTAAQVEEDLVAGNGAVEAEMAPPVEETPEAATVTPLVPPEPADTPEVLPDPADTAAPPDPDQISQPETEEAAAPPATDTPEPAESAAEPESDVSVSVGSSPFAASEPTFQHAITDTDDPTDTPADATPDADAPPPGSDAPLPSFMRRAPEPEPEDDVADVASPEVKSADPGALPSFLTGHSADPEAASAPDATAQPDAQPTPRIVDVPPDPDPAQLDAAPSALTRAVRARHMSDDQRNALRPVLARLAALRDQMAGARRDSRQ